MLGKCYFIAAIFGAIQGTTPNVSGQYGYDNGLTPDPNPGSVISMLRRIEIVTRGSYAACYITLTGAHAIVTH